MAPRSRPKPHKPESYSYPYPRPALTADAVVFRVGKLRKQPRLEVLLVKRRHTPFKGCWALPGGFVHENEAPNDAVRRELFEETGVTVSDTGFVGTAFLGHTAQVGAFADPGRDPRGWVVSIAFWAVLPDSLSGRPLTAGDDAAAAKWHPYSKVLYGGVDLAFDHRRILLLAAQKMRLYTTLPPDLG